ncbi:hypothetical protein GNQ08_20595 [Paenibacillus macerans]|uniref:Uncharacterized protein n=1 Tax=Paenibacillus macerans TaxID=44252 RepID=A0A6N8F2B1_PAEMA|nr:hypothetical protein [Paenibacillus macerans]MUG24771.1 hypothetical protein [Paenibacillus macerans]
MTISKQEAQERAKRNWTMWRLLLSDMNISYADLFLMDADDVAEANAALDIHLKALKKKNDK